MLLIIPRDHVLRGVVYGGGHKIELEPLALAINTEKKKRRITAINAAQYITSRLLIDIL